MNRRQVVTRFFMLSGLYTLSASLIWSVNTLFLLDAGLSIGEVFVANAAFTAGMVLFEIPTGVVADTLGRRVSYLFSVAVLAVTTILYLTMAATGRGVVAFAVVSLLLGLGFTFYSGALESWMVDAIAAVGGGDLDHIFARGQQVTGVAMLSGTIGGGFLGQMGLAVPFVARAVLLVVVFGLAASLMREQGFVPRRLQPSQLPREMAAQARVGITHGWSRAGLRPLILTSAVTSGFLYWGFYAAQPYFLELLRRDAVWVAGFVTALLSVATIAGNQVVDWLARRCRRRTTLLGWAVGVLAAAAFTLGVTDSFAVGLVAFALIGGAMGVVEPVHHAYLHTVTTSEHRATVVSFASMIASAGGVGGQLGLGAVSDARSLGGGYATGGIATLLALPLLWAVRKAGGPGDVMVGRQATDASCAATGLPMVAQVESQPTPVVDQSPEGAH